MRGIALLLGTMVALLTACGHTSTSHLPVSPALLDLVGADAAAIAGGQVKPLVSAGLLPPLEGMSAAGLDPTKDISEFLAAYDGKSLLFLARGTFRETELQRKLQEAKADSELYGGKTIWKQGDTGVVLVRSDIVAAGPVTTLRSVIDGKRGTLNPALRNLLEQVPGDAHVWVASLGGIRIPTPPRSNLGNMDKVLSLVSSARASANVGSGVRFQANATGVNAAGAKQLHDALRGLLGLARLSTPTNRGDLLKAYDAIDIRQKDADVVVTAYLPQDSVDALLGAVRGGLPRPAR